MDEFEQRYLRIPTALRKEFFFCAGPSKLLEPFSSVSLGEMDEYSSKDVANAIDQLPNVRPLQKSEYLQTWLYVSDSRSIELQVDGDNTGEDGTWLACGLTLDCRYADLVELWQALRISHPAMYLHDPSCRMYSPCSFIEEVAVRTLAPAFSEQDPSVRQRALDEFTRYRSISGFPRQFKNYWREMTPCALSSLFELSPPVSFVRCKDVWHVDDWIPQVGLFDQMAHESGLRYFTYPDATTINGRYWSWFGVFISHGDLERAEEIAKAISILDETS